jgi:hypothetical protein
MTKHARVVIVLTINKNKHSKIVDNSIIIPVSVITLQCYGVTRESDSLYPNLSSTNDEIGPCPNDEKKNPMSIVERVHWRTNFKITSSGCPSLSGR